MDLLEIIGGIIGMGALIGYGVISYNLAMKYKPKEDSSVQKPVQRDKGLKRLIDNYEINKPILKYM